MSNIPKVRWLLMMALNGDMDPLAACRTALPLLARRKPVRNKTKPKSAPVNGRMAEVIRRYAAKHPEMSIQQIAVMFDVNAGRVSEALHRQR